MVAAAVVAGIAWTFLTTEQLAKRSDATLQLIQAAAGGDSEVLAKVGDTYSDTEAGSWARLYQGQQLMIQGMTALYRNREEAEILLSDAKQALQSAVNSSSNNLLASRGHYAIAQIEALGDVNNEQGGSSRCLRQLILSKGDRSQRIRRWSSEQKSGLPL